uniref:Uncharacterized protein n=1 Tax=Meloidogyne incognita TaxID=6306 RepID=A0A914MRB7_MELIC
MLETKVPKSLGDECSRDENSGTQNFENFRISKPMNLRYPRILLLPPLNPMNSHKSSDKLLKFLHVDYT